MITDTFKSIYSYFLGKIRNVFRIHDIEKELKDLKTSHKRLELLIENSKSNVLLSTMRIPPLTQPQLCQPILKTFAKFMQSKNIKKPINTEVITLIDYEPSIWKKELKENEITIKNIIVPDSRRKDINSEYKNTNWKFIDFDLIPLVIKESDYIFIPSPYFANFIFNYPHWFSQISQKINKGIIIGTQKADTQSSLLPIIFSEQNSNKKKSSSGNDNRSSSENKQNKPNECTKVREILHQNGFTDVILLNPEPDNKNIHSKYCSSQGFYFVSDEPVKDSKTNEVVREKNTSKENQIKANQIKEDQTKKDQTKKDQIKENTRQLSTKVSKVNADVYFASRLPLSDSETLSNQL